MYVELHARSAFSFLEGASLPELLMARCAELEMPAMALLDRNGLYGAPRFHITAEKLGLRAHIGAEIAVWDAGDRLRPPDWAPHWVPVEPVRFPLLAESVTGYQNLCRLITRYKLREGVKAEGAATLADMHEHAEGLVCLTGGNEGPLASALSRGGFDEGLHEVERLINLFGRRNVYVECNNLGVCYHKGECGLPKDDTRAADLYRKACRGGDSSACHNLDLMKN